MQTYLIAEMGSCHDGSLDRAKELVEIAAVAGASACKGQFWSSPSRLSERRRAPEYETIYKKYQMPEEWLPILAKECKARGIEWLCTSYLPEDIDIVAPYVSRFKVASFESQDLEFVRAHFPYGKEIIVSTGMSDHKDTVKLMNLRSWCDLYGGGAQIKLLHCVSGYPTPLDQLNLSAIRHYDLDGFSDHSGEVQTGEWAVLMGARILEVHFKSEDTDELNPDAPHALYPSELVEYILGVGLAESAIGFNVKTVQPAEMKMREYRVQP